MPGLPIRPVPENPVKRPDYFWTHNRLETAKRGRFEFFKTGFYTLKKTGEGKWVPDKKDVLKIAL